MHTNTENTTNFSGSRANSRRRLLVSVAVAVLLGAPNAIAQSATDAAPVPSAAPSLGASALSDRLMVIAGQALVDAGSGKWSGVRGDLSRFESAWNSGPTERGGNADRLRRALDAASTAVSSAESEPSDSSKAAAARSALSQLARATDQIRPGGSVEATGRADVASADRQAAAPLFGLADEIHDAVAASDRTRAVAALAAFIDRWHSVEAGVRGNDPDAYRSVEVSIAFVRVAIQSDPPDFERAESQLASLEDRLADYIAGRPTDSERGADAGSVAAITIPEFTDSLRSARSQISAGDISSASSLVDRALTQWPSIEGDVQARSSAAYAAVEEKLPQAASLLASTSTPGNADRAYELLSDVIAQLNLVVEGEAHYNAVDAGLILFREGLEALLVLAALLAMLKRTGNSDRRGWIWSGAALGLAVSVGAAMLLGFAVSAAATGSAREAVEGFVGIASVALMLLVGIWLHRRASVVSRAKFLRDRFGRAVSGGRLLPLFGVAFLAVAREGGETSVFYVGISSGIAPSQLALGISFAALLLVAIGFLVIRFSARLPLHYFFRAAVILIYYLAFKILGESIHSLQVSGMVAAHPLFWVPRIGFLGIFPTWESFMPQLCGLIVLVAWVVTSRLSHRQGGDEGPSA